MTRESCEDVREMVSAGIDGHATELERAATARHLRACRACRAFAGDASALAASVRTARRVEPWPLAPALSRAGHRRRRALALRFAVAAAVVAAGMLGSTIAADRSERPSRHAVRSDSALRLAMRDESMLRVLKQSHSLTVAGGPAPASQAVRALPRRGLLV